VSISNKDRAFIISSAQNFFDGRYSLQPTITALRNTPSVELDAEPIYSYAWNRYHNAPTGSYDDPLVAYQGIIEAIVGQIEHNLNARHYNGRLGIHTDYESETITCYLD